MNSMRLTLLLADHAQVADGKLNLIGGGWTYTGPAPMPAAVAAIVEVPWDVANDPHTIVFALQDQDGHAVLDPEGNPIRVEVTDFETGRPPGSIVAMPLSASFAFNYPPIPLEPGKSYSWIVTIDGEYDEDWSRSFTVRKMPPNMRMAS